MLKLLRDTLQRGLRGGVFHHIDPETDAQFIHGVVWAGINEHGRLAIATAMNCANAFCVSVCAG